MKRWLLAMTISAMCVGTALAAPSLFAAARTLDIYFIDVEGGQATLIVTPAGESLLIDTGFPAEGTFASKPADPTEVRDAQRIFAVPTTPASSASTTS